MNTQLMKNKIMKTTLGSLRNITSGILHTEISEVYKFFEEYLGMDGIMTHQLPSACNALQPILKEKLPDKWFTEEWIQEGLGESVEVPDLTQEEGARFWKSYQEYASEMWSNIKDKTIVIKS